MKIKIRQSDTPVLKIRAQSTIIITHINVNGGTP